MLVSMADSFSASASPMAPVVSSEIGNKDVQGERALPLERTDRYTCFAATNSHLQQGNKMDQDFSHGGDFHERRENQISVVENSQGVQRPTEEWHDLWAQRGISKETGRFSEQ
jgi:hypothetical protein